MRPLICRPLEGWRREGGAIGASSGHGPVRFVRTNAILRKKKIETGTNPRILQIVLDLARNSGRNSSYAQKFCRSSLFDWCCFYYFLRNSLVALLEALFAQYHGGYKRGRFTYTWYPRFGTLGQKVVGDSRAVANRQSVIRDKTWIHGLVVPLWDK